ncbi:hypothetical protein V5799_021580 [Amblyomma americanum]|uniref:Uncharacterized protein n=1 Tax=Amblyomma americanum TaxID=6943 RepID=A0AAQ4FMW8_AMBAM
MNRTEAVSATGEIGDGGAGRAIFQFPPRPPGVRASPSLSSHSDYGCRRRVTSDQHLVRVWQRPRRTPLQRPCFGGRSVRAAAPRRVASFEGLVFLAAPAFGTPVVFSSNCCLGLEHA